MSTIVHLTAEGVRVFIIRPLKIILSMNRIKTYLGSSGSRAAMLALAVIFASAGIAQAATTISTYITTGGALTVAGQSSLAQATTTMLTVYPGPSYFGGSGVATTTIDASGNVSAVGTLGVTGLSTLTGGAKIGASGSTVNQIVKGTCNLYSGTNITTIAASSTVNLDCQGGVSSPTVLSGVVSGDVVFIQAPATMPSTFLGLRVVGATASTTSGYIQVALLNGTGATYTLASAATSSLRYLDIGQ